MAIGGYSINGYQWLSINGYGGYSIMIIGRCRINGYQWLFY